MADPVNEILPKPDQSWPSQDDPANYEWWRDYHQTKAEQVAALTLGENQADRVMQLIGEMDHRSAARGFEEQITRHREKEYATKLRSEMEARGAVPPFKTAREGIVSDTAAALRDWGIPPEFADYAVTAGNLDRLADAADRERFYSEIVEAKEDLDRFAGGEAAGEVEEKEGLNYWKAAIAAASTAWERKHAQTDTAEQTQAKEAFVRRLLEDVGMERNHAKEQQPSVALPPQSAARIKVEGRGPNAGTSQPRSSTKVDAGMRPASAGWAMTSQQVRETYPLLQSERDTRIVNQAGARRAWLATRIPEAWRGRLNINTERIYNNGMERGYQKLVDKQANNLLKQRGKALENLRGVNPTTTPAHLLPSKQYRAAENLVRIDQELRRLRPLSSEQVGAAVKSARATATSLALENAPDRRQEAAPEKTAPAQAVATRQDAALKAVREIRAQVPVDGYRSKAAEAMANRIVQRLQEGRETIQLSTRYAGGDQGQANATHRNAVEANAELIEAVRGKGIPVDTGAATVAAGKKSEVELNAQVEADQAMENLS